MQIKQSASYSWLVWGCAFAFVLGALPGCGDTEPEAEPTAAEYFAENQAKTETPHGLIDIDSVEELDGDWIQYTVEGRTFKARSTKKLHAEGVTTYTYSDVEEVE